MGLLDEAATGWEDWWHPKTVPTGAAYDPETLGSARAGAIGNIGGNLLALAQGGLSPETRAQLMLGIGKTPLTYQQELRLERAAVLQEQGWTQDAAARAAGLADARVLRRLRAAVASPPTGSR